MLTSFVTDQLLRRKPKQAIEQIFERCRLQRLCPKDSAGFPGIVDMINTFYDEEKQIVIETCIQTKFPQSMMDADCEAIERYRLYDLESFAEADRIVESFRVRKQQIIVQREKGLVQPKNVAKALDILQNEQDDALIIFFEKVYSMI